MKLAGSFSERLREAMNIRDIRAIDLSNNTGISKPLISNYLKGKYKPKQEAITKIARYLRVSEVWLMGYDDVEMDRYPPTTNGKKREINDLLDRLTDDDLQKIGQFIRDYFIDRK